MVTARDISETVRRLYDKAPGLTRLIQTYRPFICPFEAIMPHVPKGARVLDVGCGSGLFLNLLGDTGGIAAATGFDTNGEAIRVAALAADELEGDVRPTFEAVDAADRWPGGDVDTVTMIDVMHHIDPDAQLGVLDTAIDRLPAGGTLLYKDMARRPLWMALMNRLHDLVLAREWIHYLPIDDARTHLISRGMIILHEEVIDRYWYRHELLVCRKS